ncbi:MAG: dTMP kinase [Thermodesulfovibrionales bacterium]
MNRGIFISFEGIEGSGKTTQARLLHDYLYKKGLNPVLTEEPGGTDIGREIRKILLSLGHFNMHPVTELLLYNASRSQHVNEVILPAIKSGRIVITDRFSDSTYAYQGWGRGLDRDIINRIDEISTGGVRPDITILIDVDVNVGLMRNRKANKVDRIELEEIEFHRRVRDGYLEIARQEPNRIKIIDGSKEIEDIHRQVIAEMESILTRMR